jgi:probable F420-dependent oxidoreductase
MDLGRVGVWSGALRSGPQGPLLDAAAELEDLGYGTIWFPGGQHADLADHVTALLERTRRAVIATGIVSIWTHPPEAIAAMHDRLAREYPERFLLGLGVSHEHAVSATGQTYERPYAKMVEYFDALDRAPTPVPVDQRILAALGPRMLHLAAERSLGTHPYFVPPEHTRLARVRVGPLKIVAPEQMVVLESDPQRARAIARLSAGRYLNAPNYTNNLVRLGFPPEEFREGGSDRVIDAIIAWGEPAALKDRIDAHFAAGANHVCVQVLTDPPGDLQASLHAWRQIAATLT